MNTSNQMQAVAAQAAIGQEPVVCTVTYAITGDSETDFIAAINACFKGIGNRNGPMPSTVGDGNRMAQRVCEYLASRFKSQAEMLEKQDRFLSDIQKSQIPPSPIAPNIWEYQTIGSTAMHGEMTDEEKAAWLSRWKAEMLRNDQSGTHSPSTHCPDSAGSAPNGGGSSASLADGLRSLPDIEPEKPCSAPGPMGWPVDDHH